MYRAAHTGYNSGDLVAALQRYVAMSLEDGNHDMELMEALFGDCSSSESEDESEDETPGTSEPTISTSTCPVCAAGSRS
jgi:hypothetical protein